LVIGADNACLMNIEGRLRKEGHAIRVMHIVEVLTCQAAA
ncbi:MAG: Fe-S oxidoreductase, partial [candidate division KSB1 bacterium]|nr:Fe-S oxidoreductase [candidate division KSB1 bacterium]